MSQVEKCGSERVKPYSFTYEYVHYMSVTLECHLFRGHGNASNENTENFLSAKLVHTGSVHLSHFSTQSRIYHTQ
jgi:hypothetical protein